MSPALACQLRQMAADELVAVACVARTMQHEALGPADVEAAAREEMDARRAAQEEAEAAREECPF